MVSSIFRPWDTTYNEQTDMTVDVQTIDTMAEPKNEDYCSESTTSDYDNRSIHCSSNQSSTFDLNISHSSRVTHNPSTNSDVSTTINKANCHEHISSARLENRTSTAIATPATDSEPISHPYNVSHRTNIFSCSKSSISSSSRQSSPEIQISVPEISNISRPSRSLLHGPPVTSRLFSGTSYVQPHQILNYSMLPNHNSMPFPREAWPEHLGIAATHQFLPLPDLPADFYAMERIRLDCARVLEEDLRAKNSSKRKDRPKNHKCSFTPCAAAFSNAAQLRGHHRIHTGERPYKCDHESCDKSFTRNEELTRHKRIHTGVKPYPCELCGKSFGRRDHLKKHGKTHEERQQIMMMPFNPYYYSRYF